MKETIVKLLKSRNINDHLIALEILKSNYDLMVEILPRDTPSYGIIILPGYEVIQIHLDTKSGIIEFVEKEYSLLIGTSSYVKILNSDIPTWQEMNYSILDKIVS